MNLDDLVDIYMTLKHAKSKIKAQKNGDELELPEIHQSLWGRNKSITLTVKDIEP